MNKPFLPGLHLADYDDSAALELVRMWRASFEQGVGVIDPHPLDGQLAYLNDVVLPQNRVRVVCDEAGGAIVGFLAASREMIAALYVQVDYHGRGIGSALLDLAKQESSGRLRLFTVERNLRAQRFYEARGFKVIARGFEKDWQLADLEYEWRAAPVDDG
jgi:ribosomal protein S18 acetylase RimI-like enzyme